MVGPRLVRAGADLAVGTCVPRYEYGRVELPGTRIVIVPEWVGADEQFALARLRQPLVDVAREIGRFDVLEFWIAIESFSQNDLARLLEFRVAA